MTGEQEKKRAWLRRAKTIEKYVQALQEKVVQYKEIQSLCNSDYLDSLELLQELEREVQEQQKQVEELLAVRESIKKAISYLHDDELKEILTKHYLTYEIIESVVENMYYERRTIQKKHLKALDKIMIPKESEMK
ncbi:MAG: hypothetical protein K2H93_03780 [Oscillospiraceae bacterium]|nr:hypothetical protein [Oscillospiraceae bacterium]